VQKFMTLAPSTQLQMLFGFGMRAVFNDLTELEQTRLIKAVIEEV
jgi:hypothetical protein